MPRSLENGTKVFCAVFKRSPLLFTVIKVLFTFKDKLRTQDILFPSLIFWEVISSRLLKSKNKFCCKKIFRISTRLSFNQNIIVLSRRFSRKPLDDLARSSVAQTIFFVRVCSVCEVGRVCLPTELRDRIRSHAIWRVRWRPWIEVTQFKAVSAPTNWSWNKVNEKLKEKQTMEKKQTQNGKQEGAWVDAFHYQMIRWGNYSLCYL